MAVHIRLRRDTAADWTATNPILLLGEAGIETDTRKMKIGDGTTVWNALGYFSSQLARTIVSKTTGSLANLAEEMGTVALGKHAIISKVVADKECRVRLYPTSVLRTEDLSRGLGVAVAEGENEPLLEVVPVVGRLTVQLFDTPIVYNGDDSPTSSIYYVIQNRSGSTTTVTVTFTVLILEA